jgi:hypothetical protein
VKGLQRVSRTTAGQPVLCCVYLTTLGSMLSTSQQLVMLLEVAQYGFFHEF